MLSKVAAVGSGIKSFVGYISVLIPILRSITNLVKVFEEGDPDDENKNGEAKKEAVLDSIEVIYEEGSDLIGVDVGKDRVMRVAEKFIDIIVNFYNLVGEFR
ncbi:hypothetical protein [Natroniella sp. ANB-PHB2]|uniref:hypothetical protein n=1 Tax=Natroniella sp. ANB-PHB2 TaxID=3384444 RepID=UPI0038D4F789